MSLPDWFMARVELDPSGCWLWRGWKNRGYGTLKITTSDGRRSTTAHRLAYQLATGRTPEGDVHHLCEVRACVNPDHLAEISRRDHMALHGIGNPYATHCPAGHPYDEANTYLYRGCRNCKTCNRERAKAAYVPRKPRAPVSVAPGAVQQETT